MVNFWWVVEFAVTINKVSKKHGDHKKFKLWAVGKRKGNIYILASNVITATSFPLKIFLLLLAYFLVCCGFIWRSSQSAHECSLVQEPYVRAIVQLRKESYLTQQYEMKSTT